MSELKIKVCGMREEANIADLIKLKPDYMGFIFYPKSKRFVGDDFNGSQLKQIPKEIVKVGVFVNATIQEVFRAINLYGIDLVQLHGDEPPQYCEELHNMHIPNMKAFRVDNEFDFRQTKRYIPHCKYLLFDTKTKEYGGSGKKFDWEVLRHYKNELPVFLSGGVGLEDIEKIKQLDWLNLHGVDINSRFEVEPALKNIAMLEGFFNDLRG